MDYSKKMTTSIGFSLLLILSYCLITSALIKKLSVLSWRFNGGTISRKSLSMLGSEAITNPFSYSMDYSKLGWGLIQVAGEDRHKFLQGLTTNDFLQAPINSLVYASLLTNKGKVLSYHAFLNTEDDVKILCETHDTSRILQHIQTFVFPLDRVYVRDVTSQYHIHGHLGASLNRSSIISDNKNDAYCIPYNGLMAASDSPNHEIKDNSLSRVLIPILTSGYISITSSTANTATTTTKDNSVLCFRILYTMFRILLQKPVYPHEITPMTAADGLDSAVNSDVSTANAVINSTQGKALKTKKIDYKLNLFELGLANDLLVRDKGCYIGQEIVARTLRSLDVQHTKRVRAMSSSSFSSSPLSSASAGVFRQWLRGYVAYSKGLVKRGDVVVKVEGKEYDAIITSSCAEMLRDILELPSSTSQDHQQQQITTYSSLTSMVCTILTQCKHSQIAPYTSLLDIRNNYSSLVEELVRGVMVCVDSRIGQESRLQIGDDFSLEELKFGTCVPNYSNQKLLSTAKLLSDKELNAFVEPDDPSSPSNPSTPVIVSDEERKRLKLEAMAKKVEALKAKKQAAQ